MITYDEALAIIAALPDCTPAEAIALTDANGRVLAEAVVARVDSPRADCSAMDGYAVHNADLEKVPVRLRVVGTSYPGQSELPHAGEGECVRIFTGAPVPSGLDRVVMQENVVREGDIALIAEPQGQARHIRAQGSDFVTGAELLHAGARLNPRSIVAAAASDEAMLRVHARPRVLILGTGDELAAPGTARQTPAAIPQSVSFGVAALVGEWGGEWLDSRMLPDDPAALEQAAAEALQAADLVIVTGGASVGERDYAKSMFGSSGLELLFSKVAIKPGKPVWLGRAGGRLVLGLPGNPTSALVTARLFLAPLLLRLAGADPASAHCWGEGKLVSEAPACGDRETFLRGRRTSAGIEPLGNQDSGAQFTLAMADVLIRQRPQSTAKPAGEAVEVIAF